MRLVRVPTRAFAAIAATLACLFWPLAAVGAGLPAATHLQIQGDGSSWAANAVNQWVTDVTAQGLQVVFTSTGSAQGRQDFANKTVDFAVSDIGYQGKDPLTGVADTSQGRQYAYLPIVAGGTSFPYNILQNGQQVRNLRLSPKTLALIFTNQITMWNDPAITLDNNGHQLPAIPIIPVVHSEGSGSSAQFSTFLDTQFPNIWRPFIGKSGDTSTPGTDFTEYFPFNNSADRAENGSDQMINFIAAQGSDGAIGYDEYSYAIQKNIPVARVENAAGYFNLPTQYDVAVALTQAQIDTVPTSPTYLLQKLGNVYTYSDPRTYPLSSYSYGIIPTSASDSINSGKRQTLADFLAYAICGGQGEMGPIGYSSLPYNLVVASFGQIDLLHTADASVDVSTQNPATCNNPTFDHTDLSKNLLALEAPQPPPCDQVGQGPSDANDGCGGGGSGGGGSTTGGGGAGTGGGGAGSTSPTTGPSAPGANPTAPTGSQQIAGQKVNGTNAASTGNGKLSAVNGASNSNSNAANAVVGGPADGAEASPEPTSLADGPPSTEAFHWAGGWGLLLPLCALLLLIVLLAPALLGRLFQRSGSRED